MTPQLYSLLDQRKKQIRLIHLEPAIQQNDDIVCYLKLASLHDEINYEALSYAWGDLTDTILIKIYPVPFKKTLSSALKRLHLKKRDQKDSAQEHLVPVTKNLYSALRRLRLYDQVRVLWIDALCINQTDLDERSHQVLYMSSIFGRASSVIVWLGEKWEGSDVAMEVIRLLGQNAGIHIDPSLSPCLTVDGFDLEDELVCSHLIHFFNLPWWKRVWIIQEFVLAQNVVIQCGERLLPGQLLYQFSRNLLQHRRTCCVRVKELRTMFIELGMSVIQAMNIVVSLEITQTERHRYDFVYILAQFRNSQTTDDRDRIYGMLSLASSLPIQPNYSLSTRQVFENFTIAIINQTGNLDILSHLFGRRRLILPSFVPDLTGSASQVPNYLDRLASMRLFNASGESFLRFKPIAPGKVVVRGILLDKINTIMNTNDGIDRMQRLVETEYQNRSLYKFTSEPIEAAFGSTMCASITGDDSFRRDDKPFNTSVFEKWKVWKTASPLTQQSLFKHEINMFGGAFEMVSIGRRFIISRKGRIGFVPESCQKGDLIAVLAGGKVPYIIRREHGIYDDGLPCYSILGDSYIHGLMDGEAVEQLGENSYERSQEAELENESEGGPWSDWEKSNEFQDIILI